MRDPASTRRRRPVPACLIALVALQLLSGPACAAFKVENLGRGTQVAPRSDAVLILGSLRVQDTSGAVLFPGSGIFPPRPVLQLFGIFPGGKRTVSLSALTVHDDGTYAAWVPPGNYLLAAFWPSDYGGIDNRSVAAIRLPTGAAPVYTGELVFEVEQTGSSRLPAPFDVTGVIAIDEAREEVQRKVERRSGALPSAHPVTIVWCTEGVPPGPDPRNAGTLQRLDAGCGSAPAEPLDER